MGDDIKIKIEVDGDEAIRQIEDLSDAMQENKQAVDDTGEASQRASRQVREHSDAVDKQTRKVEEQNTTQKQSNETVADAGAKLAGLGAAFLGANGVIELYDRWIERIEKASERLRENAQIARENAEARLDLVALQGVETIEQVNAINTAASFAGRRPGEVAQLGTFLTSQLPAASPDDINQIALAVAGAGRTSTASLTDLATGILPIYRQNGDAAAASNIFLEAVKQAGEPNVGQFGQVLGENIALIQANAGVDVGEAAGLISAATGVGISSRPALTALSNVNFAIRGQGTPAGNEVFERLGITDRSQVLSVLEQLVAANERGDLSTADLEALGGREAAGLFATLSDRSVFEDFRGRVRAVDASEDYAGNLAQENAAGIFSSSSIQRFNILSKSFESESEGIRASDTRAARAEAFRTGLTALLDAELAKPGGGGRNITPELAQRIQEEYEFQIGRGLEPEDALRIAEDVPRTPVMAGSFVARDPNQRQIRGDQLVSGRDDLSRERFFSDPLQVLVNRGAPESPGLLVTEAERIRAALDQAEQDAVPSGIHFGLPGSLDRKIDDARQERLDEFLEQPGPQSAAPGFINNGTMILNAGDPLFDDLDGRDRLA